jgi:PIN domain nuclease of toxin-antitoxin system
MTSSPPTYVTDTHALWWYLTGHSRLSLAASEVFQLADEGRATIIVPAIVVAEFYFMSVKLRQPYSPAHLIRAIGSRAGIQAVDLGQAQLELLEQLQDIPDIHDRLIAAEAVMRGAVLVTADRLMAASPNVETLW